MVFILPFIEKYTAGIIYNSIFHQVPIHITIYTVACTKKHFYETQNTTTTTTMHNELVLWMKSPLACMKNDLRGYS
mgnify:CR=1 FL=1